MSPVALGPNSVSVLLTGVQTQGKFSLTRWTMAPPPAPGPPLHRHRDADETIYLLSGALQFTIADETVNHNAGGAVVFIPRDTWHTLANLGSSPAEFLVILTPPGFEGYWLEAAALLSVGQPDPGQMLALQEKYHMETQGQARQFAR